MDVSTLTSKKLELCLTGLHNSGKSSLLNVISNGGYSEDMTPTVGLDMRDVTLGDVTIKFWDLGGQPRFRGIWERYSREVSAVVYVVDVVDRDKLSISKRELHLLCQKLRSSIPFLVLGNKIDKAGPLSEQDLMDQMEMKSIVDREVCCLMISCKNSTNINQVIDWLTRHSNERAE